ncbi:MAG TPA: ABC transporter permease [Ktedonobacteraceae bacterium]|nr:ABC transporter permease [Ktedonobacteraceae bacterium]
MDISEQLNATQATQDDVEPFLEVTAALVQKRRSQGRIIFDRFTRNRAAIGGAAFLVLLFLFCFLGPYVTGHSDPNLAHSLSLNDAINGGERPSLTLPFGTDDVGRDYFARTMVGGQTSLLVGLSSMFIAILFGVGIGSFAGYYGGVLDNLLMRFTDIILAVPLYLLLFVLSASFTDGTPRSVILLIAAFGWTYTARLVRGEFLALKEREYVLAARTIGARGFRMMFRHILPNAAGPIIVSATLLVGGNIIVESVLSFFGFGIQPPIASWGSMIDTGQNLIDVNPLLVFIPGLLIFFTVLSFNLVGDGLRDALDPYMTER